jgi:MerR family mercuric resistance operon transcriptional regulator
MRCYFRRQGRIEGYETLGWGDDEQLIKQAEIKFRAVCVANQYDGFEVWSGRRFVYRNPEIAKTSQLGARAGMSSKPLTLAELAKAAGMSMPDIERCIENGLFQPARRGMSRSGDFGFFKEHLDRLRFIKRAEALSLTVQEIQRLLDLATWTCGDVYEIIAAAVDRLKAEGRSDEPATLELLRLMQASPRQGRKVDCPIMAELSGSP